MKILEVKNNLVKISYTAQDNLVLAGFVIIEDSKYPYVAQVMSLKADSGLNYAIVKLLFTFNEEGIVKNYNGTIPELDATITSLSSNELLDILPVIEPLKIGKLAQQNFLLNIDYSALEKNLLICCDKTENTDILLSNLAKQITEKHSKSVIFDTTGTINSENKFVFGRDFKLPLNYETINFIYENDLNDVDPTSKAVIQDIFLEVQEYSKTVLDNFIPFNNFIDVVESQYRELSIPELALLKNRLLKYKEEEVFAQSAKEIQCIRSAIRGNLSTTFDISRADAVLQKQIISYIYDEICAMDLFVYSLAEINNDNADKKLIRKMLAQDKIYTTISCPHNYKYLYELKDRASNMILFAPQTVQHDFASYNVFLNKLNTDECIIYGKATQNIPLIVEMMPIEELDDAIKAEEENNISPIQQEAGKDENIQQKDDFSEESDSYDYETMATDTAITIQKDVPLEAIKEEEPENLVDLPQIDEQQSRCEMEELQETTEEQEEVIDLPQQNTQEEVQKSIEEDIREESQAENADELVLNEEPIPQIDEDILVEPEQPMIEEEVVEPETEELNEGIELNEPEVLSEEYIEKPLEEEDILEEPVIEEEEEEEESLPEINEILDNASKQSDSEEIPEPLTEEDLDYIEHLNMTDETVVDEELEDRVSEEEQPPVVPIYPAESPISNNTSPSFEPGDKVLHPKYGEGIVEKMIKYGNKILCSISFANGRRLLDPTISEIKKV